VLIVDEINRGNISRVFGELITLIETSKREGAEEALEVTLPYSKQRFSVPPNVYLIGTMNTADRSLTGLDIALRRRFRFQEVPPQPDLLKGVVVEGVDIRTLLMVLNQRIEVMLDRDHCLGHSYFLPLKVDKSLTRLELIFSQEIIPLLGGVKK
jgi:5-methylcytosine-specific restriction protein B